MKKDRKRKHRKALRVFIEIVFMALGILCAVMPSPFPLLVPIGIGTIRIISNAVKSEKEPQPIVYCNGTKQPHANAKTQKPKRREIKSVSAATPPAQTKPTKVKTALQLEHEQRRETKAQ